MILLPNFVAPKDCEPCCNFGIRVGGIGHPPGWAVGICPDCLGAASDEFYRKATGRKREKETK